MSGAAAPQRADAVTLARGAGVNLLGNIGRLSRALAIILMARLFGAQTVGLFALASIFADLVSRFVAFGQDPTVVYHVARALADHDRERAARVVGSSLFLVVLTGTVGGAFIWLTRDLMAEHVLSAPELAIALRALALAPLGLGISTVFLASTRAQKVMKYHILARSFIEPFILLCGTLAAWAFGWGLRGVALAQTVAFGVSAAASMLFYRQLLPLGPVVRAFVHPSEAGRLVRYALPSTGRDVLALGVARADLFLVGRFLTTAAAGIYTIVLEIGYLIKDVRQALEPIFAPLVAEQHHRAEVDRLGSTYARATRWALVINLAYLGVAVLAGGALLRLYGAAYVAGWTALAILMAGQVVNGAFGLSEMMLMMIGRPGLMFANMALLLALIAGLNVLLIPIWGLTGAAIGTASATVVVAFLQVIQVRRDATVHPLRVALVKPVAACAVALLVAHLVPFWPVPAIAEQVGRAILFVVLYAALLARLGLEQEERQFGRWLVGRVLHRRRSERSQRQPATSA